MPIHPIRAVQNEFSLFTRTDQDTLVPALATLGIAYIPYSPLGRGMLTGSLQPQALRPDDFRRNLPRFADDAMLTNAPPRRGAAGDRRAAAASPLRRWRSPGCFARGRTSSRSPARSASATSTRTSLPPALALSDDEAAELQRIFDPAAIAGLPYPNMSFMR